MTKVVDIGRRDERFDTACRWVARMDRSLSTGEEAELQAWMAADPKNARQLFALTRRWDKMESLSRLAELFPEAGASRQRRQPVMRRATAVVIVVLSATALWLSSPDVDDPERPVAAVAAFPDTYETAIGEQATESLADGSVLVLNTNSLVHVEYTHDARVLRLNRGEIHVDVAEDRDRPFGVIAGNRIVQAVGTAFSVEITGDQQIELVVTEGEVIVGISSAVNAPNVAGKLLADSPTSTVRAGEEILLGAPLEAAKPLTAEDIAVKLSWRDGRLIFRGEPLEAALAEVERYTTVQFVFLDDDIRTREVVGRFRAGDVDSLLLALHMNFNIAYERVDDDKVLLSKL